MMELTTIERLKLLDALPVQESILTLKIVRKLREALSFSEEELKLFDTKYEYACPFQDEVDGKLIECDNTGYFPIAPKCAEHDILMVPTGRMNMNIEPDMQTKVKEVHMGPQALTISSEALKRLNDAKMLTEAHISLYEKFFPPEEKVEE